MRFVQNERAPIMFGSRYVSAQEIKKKAEKKNKTANKHRFFFKFFKNLFTRNRTNMRFVQNERAPIMFGSRYISAQEIKKKSRKKTKLQKNINFFFKFFEDLFTRNRTNMRLVQLFTEDCCCVVVSITFSNMLNLFQMY